MAKPKQEKGKQPVKSEGGAVVSQPRTPTVLRWNPDRISLAEQMADFGNFSLMGDLCETMMADDRVSQALDRLFSATTLPLSFQLPGKTPEQSKADPICQALDGDWWKMLPEGIMREVVAWLSLARLCLVHVDGWDVDPETGRAIPKLTVWSLKYLRNDAEKGWVVRVAGQYGWSWTEVPLNDGDGNFALLMSGSSWRSVMTAPWRGISRFWLLKAYATVDWASSSERHGDGTTVLFNENEDIVYRKEDRDTLAKQVQEGGRSKVIALPDGFKAQLLLDTANTWTTFKAQVEVANTAISINLVGTNLTTEVSKGSYAAATVHQEVDASKFRGLLEGIATGLREKLIVFWGYYNFGTGTVVPYPKWDTTPPEDKKLEADTQVQASTAVLNWQKAGFKLSKKAAAEKWGLVEAKSDDDALVPVQTDNAAPKGFGVAQAAAMASDAERETAIERGRSYIDGVESHCCRQAAKSFSPLVAATLNAVEESTGFSDLQERLRVVYGEELPPTKLLKVTEAALIMAQMAGRETVRQEVATEE